MVSFLVLDNCELSRELSERRETHQIRILTRSASSKDASCARWGKAPLVSLRPVKRSPSLAGAAQGALCVISRGGSCGCKRASAACTSSPGGRSAACARDSPRAPLPSSRAAPHAGPKAAPPRASVQSLRLLPRPHRRHARRALPRRRRTRGAPRPAGPRAPLRIGARPAARRCSRTRADDPWP